MPKKSVKSGKKSVGKVSASPVVESPSVVDNGMGAVLDQLAGMLLSRLQSSAPVQVPVDVGVDVEASVLPGFTEFGDDMDVQAYNASLAGAIASQNWKSPENPDFDILDKGDRHVKVLREEVLSLRGQMEAKVEFLSNRLRVVEKALGQMRANAISAGRYR